ncbi:MAG: molybdenum cofactor guanylyltransferase [Verrucomicrobia bacterium]|jgi:molybdenum cofactor guanylyltransferase|nr:molybdenum cofactor guanylyltransferase [Verrucomicrobiota bacterium]
MDNNLIIHILAGGASRRMGSDKKVLSLQGVAMLEWCGLTAETLGVPVNVITEDHRPEHGPLAGIETGLMHSSSTYHLFLSCDMPFISAQTLKDLITEVKQHPKLACMEEGGRRGFPLIIAGSFQDFVKTQLDEGRRSLYSLFHHIGSSVFAWNEEDRMESTNVNTPDEFSMAEQWVQLQNLQPPVLLRKAELIKVDALE